MSLYKYSSEGQRAIQAIKTDPMNSLTKIPLTAAVNDSVQRNDDATFTQDIQQAAQPNQEEADMEFSEQNVNDATQSETVPSSTEPIVTVSDYLRQHLQKLVQAYDTSKPLFDHSVICARQEGHSLSLSIYSPPDIYVNVQQSLDQLSSLFQEGMVITQCLRNIHTTDDLESTDPMGEESDERADRITSAPSDPDDHAMTEVIQEQSLAVSCTNPTGSRSKKPLSKLSQLLLNAEILVPEMPLSPLTIDEQPQEFWKKRKLNCFSRGWCPALQGRDDKQQNYTQISWTKLPNENVKALLVLIQLLGTDDKPHRSNFVLPPGTTIAKKRALPSGKKRKTRPSLNDLIVKDEDGLNLNTRTILFPVSAQEYNQCKMSLPITMVGSYDISEDIPSSDNEQEETITNPSVDHLLLKLSKLWICLCQPTENGGLVCVSNSVVTELIEESKGTTRLMIDPSRITPRTLCSCGNETIIVPLSTDSEKAGFNVSLNGEQLPFAQLNGVVKKSIWFKSRPRSKSDQQSLHVMISKDSISGTIERKRDPYEGLVKTILLDLKIDYIDYSDNPHAHLDTTL